jgi:two-component system LytT family response regulator
MPLRVIVIDDEELARERVRTLLSEHPDVEIVGECGNADEAIAAIHAHEPDLIFVDLQMPEMTGLEMLQEIDTTRLPLVVFVTAHDQYAVEAFRANAVQYLLKPIDRDEFRAAMARVRQLTPSRRVDPPHQVKETGLNPSPFLKRVVVKARGRTLLLKMASIDWFESYGNYVRVHTGRQRYLLRQTMTALEATLNPHEFVRIHRTTIVNLESVAEIITGTRGEHNVILRDGTSLILSRFYRNRIEPLVGKL